MKNLLTLVLTLFTALTFGQNAINYQGVCSTVSGPVTSTTISVSVDIIDMTVAGPTVYSETHFVTTNDKGLFSIEIGNGSATLNTIDSVDFSTPTFMSLGVDTLGGSSYVNMGTSQFLSVPTAFYANQSAQADSASFATSAGSVSAIEISPLLYTTTVASNIEIAPVLSFENTMLNDDVTIFFYDASNNLLGKTIQTYGFPTNNQVEVNATLFPGATTVVFYFNTINGLQKVTH